MSMTKAELKEAARLGRVAMSKWPHRASDHKPAPDGQKMWQTNPAALARSEAAKDRIYTAMVDRVHRATRTGLLTDEKLRKLEGIDRIRCAAERNQFGPIPGPLELAKEPHVQRDEEHEQWLEDEHRANNPPEF